MNDTISRQAAIDELRKCRFVADAIEKIRGLPTAQPEKVCIANITLSEEQILEAVEKAKNEVVRELPSAQQWIPCSESLPDGRLNKSYLVQDKDGRRAVGTYTNWGWVFGHYVNDPVAWMPLPEPYKGEES